MYLANGRLCLNRPHIVRGFADFIINDEKTDQ
jgi:hypothetical protein